MRFIALWVVIVASVCLASCANHSRDYLKKDQEIGSLVVPKDVPVLKQETYYPVPVIAQDATVKPVSLLPPTMGNK